MRVFFSLRRMTMVMFAVAVSSAGCQTTKLWPQGQSNYRAENRVEAKSAPGLPASGENDGAAASLQAASAKIDRASASPETESPSYYAARNDSASRSSSATCTSGCCR